MTVPLIPPLSSHFAADRPTLPPLPPIQLSNPAVQTPPLATPPIIKDHYFLPQPATSEAQHHQTRPAGISPSSRTRSTPQWRRFTETQRQHEAYPTTRSPTRQGIKRTFSEIAVAADRMQPHPVAKSIASDTRQFSYQPSNASHPQSARSSISDPSTPDGTISSASAMGQMTSSRAPSVSSSNSNAQRCRLHIRQQPRAARAGPDGKDRRSIDPPPVLQMLMYDFDINSEKDMAELKSNSFVVHAKLVSVQSPSEDLSTLSPLNEDGSRGQVQRLLLGTTVSSPFFCHDDPDIEHMPTHPVTEPTGPPSPTSRFIQTSKQKSKSDDKAKPHISTSLPACVFIFADLSVRKAGEYRLEFRLMKMEPSNLVAGSSVPTIHSVTSQVFKVVNAKDFDQVQPSTNLVKGLLDRGAGFPLKLKKGTREGQRRRPPGADSDENDEDDDEG